MSEQDKWERHPHAEAFDLRGGPAFPISISGCGDNGCHGMSLRDWFAGKALAGLVSAIPGPGCADWNYYSEAAYKIADAMLDERKKS